MEEGYLLVIKTVDGKTHEVKAEGDNAEVASLWVRNMEYGPWFEYLDDKTLKYINRNNIVSIDVLDVQAEEQAKEERHKNHLAALKKFNN